MTKLCESEIEKMAIEELESLGYTYIAGVDLAPGEPNTASMQNSTMLKRTARLSDNVSLTVSPSISATHFRTPPLSASRELPSKNMT